MVLLAVHAYYQLLVAYSGTGGCCMSWVFFGSLVAARACQAVSTTQPRMELLFAVPGLVIFFVTSF
jgi:hypothetical protein